MRPRSLKPPLASRPSWWLEEARAFRPDPIEPPLAGPLEVDVAIVGGGYTGLWTALALRERDASLSVALLEAREIGDGPSGRNGGFLHGYWSSIATLRSVLGDGAALQLAHASGRIVPSVSSFLEQRGEDVWLREGGLLKVAATEAEDASVARSVQAARDLGVEEEAVALGPDEVRRRLDSPRFRRGVHFRDGAIVQPARLALALKRAARAAGVQLFEHTPATTVQQGTVVTPGGTVRTREIVLALNAWATGWPLAGRQTTFASAVVLTEPVPDLLAEIGWTGNEAVTDGRMFLHYFRTTPDGRVLMGSGSGRLEPGGRVGRGVLDDEAAQARAHDGLRTLLPALAHARIDARWSGPIDVSADKLPRFGTIPGTRIHFGAGYSGNGVGPSWLGGQILASLALGVQDEWTALPLVDRRSRRLPPEPLRYVGGRVVRWGTLASRGGDRRGAAAVRRRPRRRRDPAAPADADRRPLDPAGCAAVLDQVLLVVLLRRPERRRRRDLGRDRLAELSLRACLRLGRDLELLGRVGEDRGAVLAADVPALAVHLGRVVQAPEPVDELAVRDLGRIEGDFDRLGVAGGAAADRLVVGLVHVPAGVADLDVGDAGRVAEVDLDAPEAARGERGGLALGVHDFSRSSAHELMQ